MTLVCNRLRTPPLLPLLVVGILVGPFGLGLVDAQVLGSALGGALTIGIALLVFEGSLQLDYRTLAQAPRAVRGLLTVGAIATWALAAILGHYLVGLQWSAALVLGAILIVTGPTVIQPVLRRVVVVPRLHSALMAEGALIDPIGVIAAITTLEIVLAARTPNPEIPPVQIAGLYVLRLLAGAALGAAAGWFAAKMMSRRTDPGKAGDDRLIGLAMGACMGSVGLSELVLSESGLVAAAICGLIIANGRIMGVQTLRHFKEQVSILIVGTVFILLASRLDVNRLLQLTRNDLLFVVGIVLVVRPLSVALATFGTTLSIRERLFVSFLAPRGIVAVSTASIVAIAFAEAARRAVEQGADPGGLVEQGARVETLVVAVVFVTVALGGSLARPVARVLKVLAGPPSGVLIVGGGSLARELATAIAAEKFSVHVVDTNRVHLAQLSARGVKASFGDATDFQWLEEEVPLREIGWLLSLTDNVDVDNMLMRWGKGQFGDDRVFRWSKPQEGGQGGAALGGFRSLRAVVRDLDESKTVIESWTGTRPRSRPLVLLHAKSLKLIRPDEIEAERPPEARVIGIAPAAAPATAAPAP